ncbi:hypothetical protein [Pseudomaricurvus sp. HS19]|uniref:hypothetical protein n=1 Tax=Pseudomaricurvus sp. HS19 TaxID=2692626 RepID=UPI00136FF447|nr:hypothetical protein [Pseudomaricurvus sp. HS19]MYM64255.1 hypothetical protein [Pseudomaricurvus sp. HS19]
MTDTATLLQLINRLRLPPQELSELSFCQSAKPARVSAWASLLPVTRTTHTSVLLYKALPEVSRLNTSADNRLAILEALRDCVQQCIQGLAADFLDQPLILPETAMKTAIIAQALQKHMTAGYCQVVKDLLLKRGNSRWRKDDSEQLTLALHRALTGLGLQYLRNSQIYSQVSSQLWLEIHTLYRIAEITGLQHQAASDNLLRQLPASTIQQTYCRTLLLSAAGPNQLQQQEVYTLYNALEEWSRAVTIDTVHSPEPALYCVDLADSYPPGYSSTWPDNKPRPATLRALRFGHLLDLVQDSAGASQGGTGLPQRLNQRLTQHLLTSWGEERHRKPTRRPSNTPLEVVVGLTQAHYHLSQQRTFDQFLSDASALGHRSITSSQFNSQSTGLKDPWADAPDAEKLGGSILELSLDDYRAQAKAAKTTKVVDQNRYPIYQVHTSDTSSGGYCLEWHGEIPPQARAGELIAFREPGRPLWSLAVIRWARQHRDSSQLGVQIIAQQLVPVAAQQRATSGSNVYMRAFIASRGGPEMNQQVLITAAVPFREGNKVMVRDNQEEMLLHLTKLEFSASSVCLFSYRHLHREFPE